MTTLNDLRVVPGSDALRGILERVEGIPMDERFEPLDRFKLTLGGRVHAVSGVHDDPPPAVVEAVCGEAAVVHAAAAAPDTRVAQRVDRLAAVTCRRCLAALRRRLGSLADAPKMPTPGTLWQGRIGVVEVRGATEETPGRVMVGVRVLTGSSAGDDAEVRLQHWRGEFIPFHAEEE